LEELKEAGINRKYAQTVGISVDHRRTNKSTEALDLNVARLKDYMARLVVFPKKMNQFKKGDASAEDIENAVQLQGVVLPYEKPDDAVTFAPITEVIFKME
jgi:large subunit ribosomal protein L13e